MAPGRRSKPTEQKRREGNAGKRKLPAPLRFGGELTRPADLPVEAAQLWDELVPLLEKAGIGESIDAPALLAMCLQWAVGEKARRVLQVEGYYSAGSTGQLTEHPAVAQMTRAHLAFLRFATEYGLTAAARARIAGALRGDDDEPFDGVIDAAPVEV